MSTTVDEQLNIPPHNIDAERGVLGAMLLRNDAIDLVDLQPADFYGHGHDVIYAAIKDAWNRGHRAIDATTLASELERRGTLADAGGAYQLAEIIESVPHAEHVRYYAGIVRHKSQLRQIIGIGRDVAAAAYNADADPNDLLATIDRRALAICEASTSGDFATMDDAVNALEERENNPAAIHSTGLIDFDRQISGGLKDGEFAVFGGRPGAGKTIMVDQIAMAFAQRGEPALICSLEMRREEIAGRYAKSVQRDALRKLPIQIVDTAHTLPRIASLIRLAHRRDNIQLAIVDYLQLVESDNRASNRERQVADVSRTLKRLAMELNILVIAASQLNRGTEHDNRKPRLSDLRESGAIEQDADVVGLLHRGDDGEAELVVAKQRNGPRGIVHLAFRPEVFRFENVALVEHMM